MEKIQERSMKWLWLPKVLFIAALLLLLGSFWIAAFSPVFGMILYVIFFLSAFGLLVTSLVYDFYFYYQLSLDVNAICEGDGIETKSYLFVFALNTITFGIYGKYWIYKVAQRLQANAPKYGFKMIIGGKEMLVLDLFSMGWISKWEFVRNMNRFASVYNRNGLPKNEGGIQ